jgi:hypothetical protein
MNLTRSRSGSLLAVGLTVLVAALIWVGVAGPIGDWRADERVRLRDRHMLLERARAQVESLGRLQSAARLGAADGALLEGADDAVAAAALLGRVQDLAAASGVTLAEIETLPGEARGGLRRIALRLSASGSWPAVVALLVALDRAPPSLLVDGLHLRAAEGRIEVGFVVIGFRAGSAPGARP